MIHRCNSLQTTGGNDDSTSARQPWNRVRGLCGCTCRRVWVSVFCISLSCGSRARRVYVCRWARVRLTVRVGNETLVRVCVCACVCACEMTIWRSMCVFACFSDGAVITVQCTVLYVKRIYELYVQIEHVNIFFSWSKFKETISTYSRDYFHNNIVIVLHNDVVIVLE